MSTNLLIFTTILLSFFGISVNHDQKKSLEITNNYSEFLNHGEKSNFLRKGLYENELFKTKVDILGEIFKKNVEKLKKTKELDIIFLIDASSSVGEDNFRSEIKFVKKLLSDVTIDLNHTRIGVITFSSAENVYKTVDGISFPRNQNNKCLLLNKQLPSVNYTGGETFTLGAFQKAREIFENSRNNTEKILFLITDGFSNGGDPVPVAEQLKEKGVKIFTIGIRNGNYKELYKLSSTPGETHSYLLDSFEEFESLARRALHVDLKVGDYIPLGINSPCDTLCKEGDCCDPNALCTCGTSTGHYSCTCPAGFYGTGLKTDGCSLCPIGFYSDGPNLCTPCPDAYHITEPPAYGKKSCECKAGYKSSNDSLDKCEAVKCEKLSEPSHGYFVKKSCDVVVNSACGVRCEVGYNLVGTSIRLCQNDGKWSGVAPSCQVRTCERINPPAFASMRCSHFDLGITYDGNQTNFPVDTVCSFECEKGKIFIGSRHRTCLPVAKWNGLKVACRQVKCPKIPPISNAIIEPKSCSYGKQEYGKKCYIKCKNGYKTIGPEERSCVGKLGSWNTRENTYCKDVSPPNINCPENIVGVANLAVNYGNVIWEAPHITDNSDDELTVWTKPPIANLSTFQFLIGKTKVIYYAEDSSQNRGTCTTTVTILDEERPTIENCINPPSFISKDGQGANVTWEEPYIHDNGHHAKVARSHSFGYFKIGTTTVTYTAIDDAGNKNLCQMNITVREAKCDDFIAPENGRSECSKRNDTSTCVASCDNGFSVPFSANETNSTDSITFICNFTENIWYNEEGLNLPECSVDESQNISRNATTEFETDFDCSNETVKVKEMENDMKSILTNEVCIGNCSFLSDSICYDEILNENEEEKTNRIRRDITHHKNKKRRRKLKINVQIMGKYNENSLNIQNLSFRNSTIYFSDPQYVCPSGYIKRNKKCVQCPRGTYQHYNKCRSCGFGFYNSGYGKTACTPCPSRFSTSRQRSKSITDCKKQCSPGTYARRKIVKNSRRLYKKLVERATLQPFCKSCQIGYYQDDYGQLECISCPKGFTTHGYGSKDVSQCVESAEEICLKSKNVCNNGNCVVKDRIHYECNCFAGFIGSHCEKHVEVCKMNPCQNGGTCIITHDSSLQPQYKCLCFENYYGSYCEYEIERCKLKCMNGGRCIEYDDNEFACMCNEGYDGELCEHSVAFCEKNICQNNGTCLEQPSMYSCRCPKGFIGTRCHLQPCDYKPCPNNAICENVEEENTTVNSFRCGCQDGWTGHLCDVKLDFCSSDPCKNGGTCINENSTFKCICEKYFNGHYCENKVDSDYVLVFEKFRTTDYVKLPPFKDELNEITVCMWLKVTDTFNYGTLVSYATRENDNVFTLTDYTGLIMYVNGQYIATDVFLNDGIWHHVCATWRSQEGVYQVYIDGTLKQFGKGLSTNRSINAEGYMIIGQEQDILGGKFSQSETFLGRITLIDIWSKALTKSDILQHFHDCDNPIYGDLYSWPEFQFYIQGKLKKEQSQFCKSCSEPRRIINGNVEMRNKSAFYSCHEGYMIGNNYKNGRKCLKSSKWEGQREPYCRRVYCGSPGFLRNGFIRGSNFYFQDQVTCECLEGYNLTGSRILVCGKDGRWEPETPKCIGPQCRAFKIPDNGEVTVFSGTPHDDYIEEKSMFDVSSQIEIKCKDETNLVGESVLTCQENGIWDYDPPICQNLFTTTPKPKRCSLNQLPATPENGHPVQESIESYDNELSNSIEFNCNIGFKPSGLNVSFCLENYWSDLNMTCARISCSSPGRLENGFIIGENYKFGDELSFECEVGFTIEGMKTITCNDDGTWDGVLPTCKRIVCDKLTNLTNGMIIGENNSFGDKIEFQCNEGYELKGSAKVSCGENGVWNDELPKCVEIKCGSPGDIENGLSFGRSYSYGEFVTFECNEGFNLTGEKSIRCGEKGTWEPKKPYCQKITCKIPQTIENGVLIGEKYSFGDKISFKCFDGYSLEGNASISCNKNGYWTSSEPKCRKISCGRPQNFENGKVLGESFSYEDIVEFNCDEGFSLDGNNIAVCEKNKKWSFSPQCTRIFCGSPGSIENGLVYGNNYYYNDTIVFECNIGYELSGSTSSTCSEDGKWKPMTPTCIIKPYSVEVSTKKSIMNTIVCKPPKVPINTIKLNEDKFQYIPGDVVNFECIEGFKMLGNNFIKCSKYGKWSRLQGKCRRISCRQPEVSKSTKIIGESYLYEDIVTLICANGGEYQLKCSGDGIWIGKKDISC